jgi:hypothetical protein
MAKTRRVKSKRLHGGNEEHGPDTAELMNRIRTIQNGILNLRNLNITSLPPLPLSTTRLNLRRTQVTSLPEPLPPNLILLDISDTRITRLPKLPDTLRSLLLINTGVTSLPESLPPNLEQLTIHDTGITQLPALPGSLNSLGISNTGVTRLPEPLPDHLEYLDVSGTPMTSLPTNLPYLRTLYVSDTKIGRLPELPPSLSHIDIHNTSIEPLGPYESVVKYNDRMKRLVAKDQATFDQTLGRPSDNLDNSALGKLRRSNILPNLVPEYITGKKEPHSNVQPGVPTVPLPTVMQQLKKDYFNQRAGRTKKKKYII